MQLLHGSTAAIPQYVAVCFVSTPGTDESSDFIEPFLLASPLGTVSRDECLRALRELVRHLTSKLKVNTITQQSVAVDLLKEEETQPGTMQIFRALSAHGLAIYYKFVQDEITLKTLSPHLMAAATTSGRPDRFSKEPGIPLNIAGCALCVGMSGAQPVCSASSLQVSLPQRMNDCLTLISKLRPNDTASFKAILSTFLLSEDEQRKTNEMVESPHLFVFQNVKREDKASSVGMMSPLAGNLRRISSNNGSAVATAVHGESGGGDGTASQATGVRLLLEPTSTEIARVMTEQLKVLSIADTDAFLRKYTATAQERKATLDLAGGSKSRFNRRKNASKGTTRDPDFDNFDYKGPVKATWKESIPNSAVTFAAPASNGISTAMSKTATTGSSVKPAVPALAAARTDVGQSRRASMASIPSGPPSINTMRRSSQIATGPRRSYGQQFISDDESHISGNSDNRGGRRRINGNTFVDDASNISDARSGIAPQGRLQVNIALNEDLACSYKQSQVSSCSVEGVVQVQVKSSGRMTGPFLLTLRDLSHHIESLQENKTFSEDMGKGHEYDSRYAISVPKGDTYIPVMRYKCIDSLRPVPLRVQTRVKTDGEFCRVALQISSNPNNEANLTDLTIIMGVPDEVDGESLITQPEGGVWNESKRSVIWCVSELGNGEKFQLQARFAFTDVQSHSEEEKPKFPVLIRSQCLFAQLSDIEVDVRDMPDIFPADIEMKLARRFRISHRERS